MIITTQYVETKKKFDSDKKSFCKFFFVVAIYLTHDVMIERAKRF